MQEASNEVVGKDGVEDVVMHVQGRSLACSLKSFSATLFFDTKG